MLAVHPLTVPAEVSPIVSLMPYQRADVLCSSRFCCSNWSRQIGKSFGKSLRRLIRGLERKRNQIFISSGERQCVELINKVKMHCKAMNIDASAAHGAEIFDSGRSFKAMQIDLPGGIKIWGLPANPDTARGYTGDVLIDEMGGMPYDEEIWSAIFPSCLRGAGEVDVCSTPKGKKNLFYKIWNNPTFHKTQVTIYDAVAAGLSVDVDSIRKACSDEMIFRQEFLCEFIDEATAFITLEMIDRCSDPKIRQEMDPESVGKLSYKQVHIGIDIGRKNDLTVIWLMGVDDDQLFTTITYYVMKKVSFKEQERKINSILKSCRDFHCCVDSTGIGMQLAENLTSKWGERRVEPIPFTMNRKYEMADIVRSKMIEGRMTIPEDDTVRRHFHSVERKVTDFGNTILTSGRDEQGHADLFWAASLSAYSASKKKPFALAMAV